MEPKPGPVRSEGKKRKVSVKHDGIAALVSKSMKEMKPLKAVSGLVTKTEAEEESPIESLDDWQQQFLNFITYPSDHILTTTGTKVLLRDTVVWGRQKELWSMSMMELPNITSEEGPSTEVQSNVLVKRRSKKMKRAKQGSVPAKAGGNHLSQQLFVQAALATVQQQQRWQQQQHHEKEQHELEHQEGQLEKAETDYNTDTVGYRVGGDLYCISDDELFAMDDFTDFETAAITLSVPTKKTKRSTSKASTVLMIRRNEEQALWFHGGTTTNQNLGEWVQNERESYHKDRMKTVSFSGGTAAVLTKKSRPPNSRRKQRHRKINYGKTRPLLSGAEMDERYEQFQRSFQYNLLQLVGMDLQSIRPEATMFYGKYYKE